MKDGDLFAGLVISALIVGLLALCVAAEVSLQAGTEQGIGVSQAHASS